MYRTISTNSIVMRSLKPKESPALSRSAGAILEKSTGGRCAHSSVLTKEAELGIARSWGVSAPATHCVIVAGKRNVQTKPPRVQLASSFIVILILFIAGCDRAEESGCPCPVRARKVGEGSRTGR